eukprot:672376-Pyramimonas_sp.AAC.1
MQQAHQVKVLNRNGRPLAHRAAPDPEGVIGAEVVAGGRHALRQLEHHENRPTLGTGAAASQHPAT